MKPKLKYIIWRLCLVFVLCLPLCIFFCAPIILVIFIIIFIIAVHETKICDEEKCNVRKVENVWFKEDIHVVLCSNGKNLFENRLISTIDFIFFRMLCVEQLILVM